MHQTLRSFELLEPETIKEATKILFSYGDKAKVLAGGIDLVSRMRRWQMKPEYVVSIKRIPNLNYITINGSDHLCIGALTSLHSIELSPIIKKNWMLLYEATCQIASVQVKTMGTAVGNLCGSSPASDIAPTLFVLGAKLKIVNHNSEKIVPIENFFIPVCQNILKAGEIVTEISVPKVPAKTGGSFLKLAHTAACIAKVNVAVTLTVADDTCKEVKIALGAVAPTVIIAKKAEAILKGQRLEQKVIKEAAIVAARESMPINDFRSTAEYRTEMVEVLVQRAIYKALERVA